MHLTEGEFILLSGSRFLRAFCTHTITRKEGTHVGRLQLSRLRQRTCPPRKTLWQSLPDVVVRADEDPGGRMSPSFMATKNKELGLIGGTSICEVKRTLRWRTRIKGWDKDERTMPVSRTDTCLYDNFIAWWVAHNWWIITGTWSTDWCGKKNFDLMTGLV